MEPRILNLPETKLVGIRITTSLSENRTAELWQGFMPRKKEIKGVKHTGLYSIQKYGPEMTLGSFTPQTIFEKWAAVEVDNFNAVPEGMETLIIPEGKYAVFVHKGPPQTFPQTMSYIHGTWLPNSEFELDHRPHFELMGEKYRNNHPDSEEETFVPIK